MGRRLTLLAIMASLATLAAPALAAAAPAITRPAGILVPKEFEITGTSTNTKVKTPLGTIGCGKFTTHAVIEENTGTKVRSGAGPAGTATECSLSGMAVQVTKLQLRDLISLVAGSGSVSLTFEVDLPLLTCHFEGDAIPFTYAAGGAAIQVNGALLAKPMACQGMVGASIEGTWSIETAAGPVTWD